MQWERRARERFKDGFARSMAAKACPLNNGQALNWKAVRADIEMLFNANF
jgi:hypothetical protein